MFADRLLEAGDPWGELIHVQLDLAAGNLEPAAREVRTRRQDELRAAHLRRMEPAFPDGVDHVVWRRGWIDRVRLTSACFASHAAQIFDAAPLLRTIELSDLDQNTSHVEFAVDKVLGKLASTLAAPEARRLEGLIVPIVVRHLDFEQGHTSYDGTPDPSTTLYHLGGAALERIIAADLPRLHMVALARLTAAELDVLARSPLGARADHVHLGGCDAADLRTYLDHPHVCALRGLGGSVLIDHPKLALLEELEAYELDEAMLRRLEHLRRLVGKPVAVRDSIDVGSWFQRDGRPNWSFCPTRSAWW